MGLACQILASSVRFFGVRMGKKRLLAISFFSGEASWSFFVLSFGLLLSYGTFLQQLFLLGFNMCLLVFCKVF